MADQLTVAARARIHRAQAEREIRTLDAEESLVLATGPSAWLAKPFIETTPERRIGIADAVADFVRLLNCSHVRRRRLGQSLRQVSDVASPQ